VGINCIHEAAMKPDENPVPEPIPPHNPEIAPSPSPSPSPPPTEDDRPPAIPVKLPGVPHAPERVGTR